MYIIINTRQMIIIVGASVSDACENGYSLISSRSRLLHRSSSLSIHKIIETSGEMLEEMHNGVCPINALKVAIDRRLLGVAIF